jgi:hypothetical protein
MTGREVAASMPHSNDDVSERSRDWKTSDGTENFSMELDFV